MGDVTREAALHSNSGNAVVFRYRVQEGDSDAVDGISIPPSPFLLPPGAGVSGPGGGRVSLFFAGLEDQSGHRVYPNIDRVEGSNALVWSAPEDLYTGVDGARYRLFDRMRHYYHWNETTRRWEIEFRIADAGLDSPDQNLIQWLILRASGYHVGRPHIYGAAPVEMKPWLGGWADYQEQKQQVCIGLKAEHSPGKTREQRLEELGHVSIERIGSIGFGEYGIYTSTDLRNLLRTARDMASETTCPDPPTGVVTIQGQASTRGAFGAVLYDPNGVVEGSESWQWKRSPEGTTFQDVGYTGFQNIAGANGQSYTPGAADAGRYLRVKAIYTDGQRSTRTAWGQTRRPVTEQPRGSPPPQQPAGQAVAADSPIVPEGMGPGDSFRLLFVTSTTTTAESSDIADYNAFAQARAAANTNLAGFSGQFRALISTAGVNIKDNTATTGTGVPVHWLGGEKAADDYADLYDVSWDSVSGLTEAGSSYTGLVWTGGNGYGDTSLRRYAGAAEVRMGDLGDATRPLSSPTARAATEFHPLYALSPVLTVAGRSDREGTVSLDTETPQVDTALTATLLDPDGVVENSVAWQWQRSPEGTTAQDVDTASFEDIPGATGAAYTPVDRDVGRWLRATATYADGHGPGKTAQARTASPVSGQVQGAPEQQAAVIIELALRSAGSYGEGDAIAVDAVFSRDVTVAGVPELSIEVGGERRTATYDSARSAPAVLVFSYTVQAGDRDADGVSVYPGRIVLPAGASIRDDQGTDAELAHSGLAPQPGHTVDGSLETSPPQQQQATNNEPQFNGESVARSVEENAATGASVGDAVTATDADGDALTYALTGSNAFGIDGEGQITVQGALDHETHSSYSLTVTVSDGKNASGEADASVDDTITVTVSIGNVDEAGTVSLDSQTPQAGSPVSASLTDPDGAVSGETWAWERSADRTAWAAIAGANAQTYTPSADDVGKYLQAMVSYADGQGPGKSASAAAASAVTAAAPESLTIAAGPVIASSPQGGDTYGLDEAITVTLTFSEVVTVTGEPRVRLKVGERQRWARYSGADGATLTFVYKVKKVDADDDGVSIEANRLKLNGGSIQDSDGNAAVLSHPALPAQLGHKVDGSLEEQPSQQQQAANRAPQFSGESLVRNVDENTAAGTNVGDAVTATDADGDTLAYALTGSNAFTIDGAGQITVQGALDHETQASYSLTITVSDGKDSSGGADDGVDDSIAVTVSVVNVDEKGKVSVDLDPPQSGSPLRASLLDPDGVAGGSVTWQWKRSPDGTTARNVDVTDFNDIPGATGASYTPVEGDVGRWLRVLAIYTDVFGSGKRARAQTANPVERQQAPPPTVTGVAVVSDPGEDNTYVLDDVIHIRVTFSAAVNVSGNPRIKIDMDLADWGEKWAAYQGGSGTSSLTFTHTVVEPNFSSQGIAVLADSLDLNGGGIVSASASVAANLSHAGLDHDPDHKVDWQG